MIEDLKAYCIIYIVTLWVILFRFNSKSIRKWKQKLIIWNNISLLKFQSFRFLFTFIHLSLASFTELFKHKSLSFVNLSFFLHDVSIFWWERLPRPVLKVHVFWCKTGVYGWNLSEKVFLMYRDSFPIPLVCISVWSITASPLSIIELKALESGWSTSELAMFLKIVFFAVWYIARYGRDFYVDGVYF